jgi:hypothetical protein
MNDIHILCDSIREVGTKPPDAEVWVLGRTSETTCLITKIPSKYQFVKKPQQVCPCGLRIQAFNKLTIFQDWNVLNTKVFCSKKSSSGLNPSSSDIQITRLTARSPHIQFGRWCFESSIAMEESHPSYGCLNSNECCHTCNSHFRSTTNEGRPPSETTISDADFDSSVPHFSISSNLPFSWQSCCLIRRQALR